MYVIREEKGGGERRMKENRKYQDESHTVGVVLFCETSAMCVIICIHVLGHSEKCISYCDL